MISTFADRTVNSGLLFSFSVSLTDCDPVDEKDTCFSFMKVMNTLSTGRIRLFFDKTTGKG